jgi:hypothetical protein
VDWGDGAGPAGLALAGQSFSPVHVFGDDGSFAAEVCVTDEDDAEGCGTVTVEVTNVAPVVSAGGDAVTDEDVMWSRFGSFTDPGADSWSATVDWGEGTGPVLLAPTGQAFDLAHEWGTPGVYTTTVVVSDDDGGIGSASFQVTVRDRTPPVVTPPADMTVDSQSASGAEVTYPAATATDLVGVTVEPTCLPASGDRFVLGSTTVTCSASDLAGNVGTATFTVTVNLVMTERTFRSVGAHDGWVLEGTETSGKGATLDDGAATGRVGDDATGRQYRAVLDFNTAALPDDAVITGVTVRIKKQPLLGTYPFNTHGLLLVDMKTGWYHNNQALEKYDFQAAGGRGNVGRFIKTAAEGWYRAPLRAPSYLLVNLEGTTQFRLRFATDDDDDGVADYLSFYTGDAPEADRPELIITYYLP